MTLPSDTRCCISGCEFDYSSNTYRSRRAVAFAVAAAASVSVIVLLLLWLLWLL